jgi:hypothetical protein
MRKKEREMKNLRFVAVSKVTSPLKPKDLKKKPVSGLAGLIFQTGYQVNGQCYYKGIGPKCNFHCFVFPDAIDVYADKRIPSISSNRAKISAW